ncbi:Cas10/Cmr2 second palm domain-containing protein [Succinimonas amylolytica]|uniref:Cas10/Cmr2 second palm domain-containing protein n=1 Tax=Succinimonas amylolytica TaxID=83769 RepID=UPI0003613429|nr:hypothetical protein [Succinimonas amylolytica]
MDKLSIFLFESKSIQAYLSRTGRLRHMIIASDRLDSLVGPDEDGLIQRALAAAGLDPGRDTNIIAAQSPDYEVQEDNGKIVFFRYLGGAFSCYALGQQGYENLVRFRFAVTLAVQTELPGMPFSDALVSGDLEDLSDNRGFFDLLDQAYTALAAAGNRPLMLLPLATACTASAVATGEAAVRTDAEDARNLMKADRDSADAVMVRLASNYQKVNLSLYIRYLFSKKEARSLRKATAAQRDLAASFDRRFKSSVNFSGSDQDENDGDIALIHMDGNSVGTTLIRLRSVLSGRDGENAAPVSRGEYTKVMLEISEMLQNSTRNAVKEAISGLMKMKKDSSLNFRPLVLGGDDVTLLMDPRYAADFCVNFARKFRTETETSIKKSVLIGKYLKGKLKFLTSSGGILFQKKKHPYQGAVRLVESLAKMAKDRWKNLSSAAPSKNGTELWDKVISASEKGVIRVNPSAVAFVRVTEASGEALGELFDRLRRFRIPSEGREFCTGSMNGFVTLGSSDEDAGEVTLEQLADCVGRQQGGAVISRFRRMLSEISCGRLTDARQLFKQARRNDDSFINNPVVELLIKSGEHEEEDPDGIWYYKVPAGQGDRQQSQDFRYESIINDILVLDHYIVEQAREESSGTPAETQEEQ